MPRTTLPLERKLCNIKQYYELSIPQTDKWGNSFQPPCQALIRLQSNQQSSHYKSGIKEEMLSLNQPSQPTILLPYRLLHLSTETIKDIKRILFTSYHRLIALLLSIFSVCSEIVVKIH